MALLLRSHSHLYLITQSNFLLTTRSTFPWAVQPPEAEPVGETQGTPQQMIVVLVGEKEAVLEYTNE